MKIRQITTSSGPSVAVWHPDSRSWIDLDAAASIFDSSAQGLLTTDLLSFLGAREQGRDTATRLSELAAADGVASAGIPDASLPFHAASLRCFMGWEKHWSQSAHQLVRRNLPRAVPAIRAYEALTRRDFPALRPGSAFAEHPVYYTGNHLSIVADGQPLTWPSYTELLDFELEFGMVIDRPIVDATESAAAAAIGGFVVFNDVSARDVQWDEQRHGPFGPVIKTKTFCSAMGSVVVTADEILPHLDDLTASVVVDGQHWSTTSTAGLKYGPGETIAYASRSENLYPGELFTSGTLPNGCGLELDRWIQPGNVVTLEIERIGSVTNQVAAPVRS